MEIPKNTFENAVRYFWATRRAQESEQKGRGMSDQGSRGAATGGRQMDGFVDALRRVLMEAGVSESDIYTSRSLTLLPGFFRPTKAWDILILEEGSFKAAIELKSQIGPSFGNNFNNRTEEATGSALDLWTAFREGAFPENSEPWLGYLLLLEDSPKSRNPVRVREPHFRVLEEYRETSYAQRYEIFCRKLILERHYNAACFLLSDGHESESSPNYLEPAKDLAASTFLSRLVRHLRAE